MSEHSDACAVHIRVRHQIVQSPGKGKGPGRERPGIVPVIIVMGHILTAESCHGISLFQQGPDGPAERLAPPVLQHEIGTVTKRIRKADAGIVRDGMVPEKIDTQKSGNRSGMIGGKIEKQTQGLVSERDVHLFPKGLPLQGNF